ncbi:MAG: hypothetical protein AB1403_17660 [Candidatus Riflebacteria bacterium]
MNRLTTGIIVAIVVLSVLFFLGRLFFLSGVQREISQTRNRLEQLENNQANLDKELEKLRGKVTDQVKDARNSSLLKPGMEFKLLNNIIELSGNLKINDFAILPSYFHKSAEDQGSSEPSTSFNAVEELPQLDEQGMPIGAATDDDTEWPGIEIVPVKFSFTTTFRNLGQFFSHIDSQMPINQIRSADIMLQDAYISRGTVVMLFPVAEK